MSYEDQGKPMPSDKSYANAIEHARSVVGSPRQVYAGGLLVTCTVFVAALLAIRPLHGPLVVAAWAFASALSMLAFGFMSTSFEFDSPYELLGAALHAAGWIPELLGTVAMLVGIGACLVALDAPTVIVFIVSGPLTLALGIAFVKPIMRVVASRRKEHA